MPLVIDQLALLCAEGERPGKSSMRCLSRAVASFAADCMQFVNDDDAEFILIEFVSTVPLVSGYDFLCNVGAAHGLVLTKFLRGPHVGDAKAVEHGIEIWRHRAKRAIASAGVMREEDLFLLLDGLARLSVGATSSASKT